ncbi:MAG: permease [Candidatus Omnitrophica bacterium]|nr:permease [Candidatus Omnitrophota bacterium]
MKKSSAIIKFAPCVLFGIFIIYSFGFHFSPGTQITYNFFQLFFDMLKVLPCAFILIGLFEIWVRREHIEKHFGEQSKFMGYVWGILLAGTTVGGLYVAFPVAYSLYNKGAKISVILTYIGASAVCRIPMTVFEASFLGIRFTLVRLIISIPLVILTSVWLGNYLEKHNYQIVKGQ